MSRHKEVKPALLAVLATCSMALLSQRAEAQARWFGSATCEVTTTANDYSDTQTHRWNILPLRATSQGATTSYSLIWTVTGHGQSSSNSWTYNGIGFQQLRFTVTATDKTHYHIAEGTLLCDRSGVHDKGGMTDQICEQQFTTPPIVVDTTSTKIQQSVPITINGKVGYQEPAVATHSAMCSVDFEFGLVFLQRFPEPIKKPPLP